MRTLPCVLLFLLGSTACGAESWLQAKFDAARSGNVPQRSVQTPLGLVGAVPLSDAIFTAPVVDQGKIFAIDGAGVVWAIDAKTLEVIWRRPTGGGKANSNNVSSPAIVGDRLHVGTMAGHYYVLDTATGSVIRDIDCGEPIFSSQLVLNDRVYFATLGSRVYALTPQGEVVWTWDFVRERLGFTGNRWSGAEWFAQKGQVGWREQFCCTRDIAMHGKMLVLPAGGQIVWLEDTGKKAEFRGAYLGQRESPATLGLSLGPDGAVFRQWTQRDNLGRVDILRLAGDKVEVDYVRGTETNYDMPGSLAFTSVSIRTGDVFRCRPEKGFGLCRHTADRKTIPLDGYPSIASPILLDNAAVYGGLDGAVYVVPLDGGKAWSFRTPWGKAFSAPIAVCDGRIYAGGEDGYLYVLGPGAKAALPAKDLGLETVRSPRTGPKTDARYDWFTSFGNFANTNAADQPLKPPFHLQWIRRYEGTSKHFPTCGGGRMYTHTAEGQCVALEQETGRLLWRRYDPGVHISYTTPLYHRERLYVPQAGLEGCFLRCLDAASGKLIWQAPFTGSPSWNRQAPPVVHGKLLIYAFSTGRYSPQSWLFEHQSTFGFPAEQKPLVRAWDLETGREAWTRDFSEYGAGGDDAGVCLLGDTLYYSCYFGEKPVPGVTVAMDPRNGRVLWVNTKQAVHAGCTISGRDGRLYLGGYNAVDGEDNRVWCLNAADGSLVWKSEPVQGAIHTITIGDRFLFTHAQYRQSYLLDKQTGKIITTLAKGYRCTRFSFCEPYLLGPNFDLFDLTGEPKMISSGPVLDVLMCVGGIVSNGRIFYTTNGSGLQASLSFGEEAAEAGQTKSTLRLSLP
ncbi:MAG: PQQ-binding-like beta-propeller repeat protein [Pirellulales bacterium]